MSRRHTSLGQCVAVTTFVLLSVYVCVWTNNKDNRRIVNSDMAEQISIHQFTSLNSTAETKMTFESSSTNIKIKGNRSSLIGTTNQSDFDKNVNNTLSDQYLEYNKTLTQFNRSRLSELINNYYSSINVTAYNKVNILNRHDFNYVLNTVKVCRNKEIFAIIYVHTAPSHYKRRMIIRQTWGNVLQYKGFNIRLIFVMGVVWEDKQAQTALEFENEQYHDIVQENFKDTYRNLTYKGIGALKWISKHCGHAKFVIKTDDDIFVNMYILINRLQTMDKSSKKSKMIIKCFLHVKPRVLRGGKWKVDKTQFKGNYYPSYCSGSAIIMTLDAAMSLYQLSYYVPFYWIDDVYLTGFLPVISGNITQMQLSSAYVFDVRKFKDRFTGNKWFNYMFAEVHDLNLFQSVWGKVVQLVDNSKFKLIKLK